MNSAVNLDALPWEPVRTDVAQCVFGKTLSDRGTKIVYTRVAPGGGFAAHRDGYGHMLFVLGGEGRAGVGEQAYDLRPGMIVEVAAGEEHFYRNTGDGDLILIAANIPAIPTAP